MYAQEALALITFGYGLAFYSMGIALYVESGRASELSLARSIRLLASFGLLHGIHAWLQLPYLNTHMPPLLAGINVALLIASFLALLVFGESLVKRAQSDNPLTWHLTLAAVTWYTLSTILVQILFAFESDEWLIAAEALARYVLGIPAAILACVGLLRQRQAFQSRQLAHFANDLTLAAAALALYGILGQLFVPEVDLFPASTINEAFFQATFGVPINLLRAILATMVAIFMIHVLRALEVDSQQKLRAIKDAHEEREALSQTQLANLNEELKQAHAATQRLLAEVQARDARRGVMLQHITAAQETERQRIARELHDDTGQALTGLAMGLRGVNASLGRQGDGIPQLAQLENIATTALGSLRLLINDLRPPQLDDMGMVAAIRWLINRLQERSSLQIELQVHGDAYALSSEVETTIFRIVQEALNNTVKHAHAQQVWVILHFAAYFCVCIRDDGIGFDVEQALNTDSERTAWGLLGIHERAQLINAHLTVESQHGQGTTLTVAIEEKEDGA